MSNYSLHINYLFYLRWELELEWHEIAELVDTSRYKAEKRLMERLIFNEMVRS